MLLIPLAVIAVVGTIHLAMIFHGRNVVAAAAQDGLFAASQFGASEADGEAAAERTLKLYEGIESQDISVERTDDSVTVTIEGQLTGPLGLFNNIHLTVTGVPEEFTAEDERQ